jgi:hypothetical protein
VTGARSNLPEVFHAGPYSASAGNMIDKDEDPFQT